VAEKRGIKRSKLFNNLKVLDAESGEGIGYAVDINLQGLRFSASRDFEPGRRLELSIELPQELLGRRSVRLAGTVKWCGPDLNPDLKAVGLQFSSISPVDRDALVVLMAQFTFSS
jgi:hypothetical protein